MRWLYANQTGKLCLQLLSTSLPREEVVKMYEQVQQARLDNELLTSGSCSSLSSDPEFLPGKQALVWMLHVVLSLAVKHTQCFKAYSKHCMSFTMLLFVLVNLATSLSQCCGI